MWRTSGVSTRRAWARLQIGLRSAMASGPCATLRARAPRRFRGARRPTGTTMQIALNIRSCRTSRATQRIPRRLLQLCRRRALRRRRQVLRRIRQAGLSNDSAMRSIVKLSAYQSYLVFLSCGVVRSEATF